MELAKPRHRVMASIVDFIIMVGIFLLSYFSKIPFILSTIKNPNIDVEAKLIFDFFRIGVVLVIMIILYYVAIPYYFNGQTIGKKMFKLQIVKENDQKVDIKDLFIREIIGKIFIDIISLGVTIFSSFLVMVIRDDKKSLSDIIAKTKVIDLYKEEE